MKFHNYARVFAAVALAGVLPNGLAAGDPAAGKTKTVICQACHGPDGNSPPNPAWGRYTTDDIVKLASAGPKGIRGNPVWAKLAGQNATYLTKQLQNFRSGARKDPLMTEMVSGLTDADIADIAAYYSAQNLHSEEPTPDKLTEQGRDIYLHGKKTPLVPACASCHGPLGRGSETLPRIAGQHAIYLQKQLWSFKLGTRTTGDKVMNDVAAKLADQDIPALAAYLSTMR